MEVVSLDAQKLSAALSESGSTFPHEALPLLLPLLPLDARACAACVCRAWRAAILNPLLWKELSFERCAARVNDATLASLCARAGAALHTLDLPAGPYMHVTGAGLVAALRGGGCSGVRRLSAPYVSWFRQLNASEAQELAAACPFLQHAACAIRCSLSEAASVSTALPGPMGLTLECARWGYEEVNPSVTQLVERLRVNAALTSLELSDYQIGDAGAAQLADCLRVNSTLTSLDLWNSSIGDAGARQFAECLHVSVALTHLAECLRVNATLTCLFLSISGIGEAGATLLAACLRINTTLMYLGLACNEIGDGGATQLADCLRVNATLTGLHLASNGIGDVGATQLAECLRVNVTLKSLDLDENVIGEAGVEQLEESMRVNTTLTSLNYLQSTYDGQLHLACFGHGSKV